MGQVAAHGLHLSRELRYGFPSIRSQQRSVIYTVRQYAKR